MRQQKRPVWVMDGAVVGLGNLAAAFPLARISQGKRNVNCDFDRGLSAKLDRAIMRVENARGIANWMWRMRKTWLESQIPFGGGSKNEDKSGHYPV